MYYVKTAVAALLNKNKMLLNNPSFFKSLTFCTSCNGDINCSLHGPTYNVPLKLLLVEYTILNRCLARHIRESSKIFFIHYIQDRQQHSTVHLMVPVSCSKGETACSGLECLNYVIFYLFFENNLKL